MVSNLNNQSIFSFIRFSVTTNAQKEFPFSLPLQFLTGPQIIIYGDVSWHICGGYFAD